MPTTSFNRNDRSDPDKRAKLKAFKERTGEPHRVVGRFKSWEGFLTEAPRYVQGLRSAIDKRPTPAAASSANPAQSLPASPKDLPPPAPPAFCRQTVPQGHDFVGRVKELGTSIGGLTAPIDAGVRGDRRHGQEHGHPPLDGSAVAHGSSRLAGPMWYSFYEDGAA